MRIVSDKIPLKMGALPELYVFLNKNGSEFIGQLYGSIRNIQRPADSSNARWSHIAEKILSFQSQEIYFEFYTSKNIFVGHNVISHATDGDSYPTVNYNTRFHSVKKYSLPDWISNFGHELTHLADQRSSLSFSHKNQKDKGAAPFIVGEHARQIYLNGTWV